MDLKENVFKNYDISSLKIFYTILKFIKMEQIVKGIGTPQHPAGYYTCEMNIKDLAKAINYKSRHIERLEKLGQKASEVFRNGIGTKGEELDEFGNYEYETIHPIYRHKYKNGVFSVDIPVTVFDNLDTFFMIKKIDEALKLDDKISFRLYQMLFSNIKNGVYIIHLDHFQKLIGTDYENKTIHKKLKESIVEINEKTDISIGISNIEPVYKKDGSQEKLVSLKLKYFRKTVEVDAESAKVKTVIAEAIEKACTNRFFEKKYKSNPALNNAVLNNLVADFSEEIVIKAIATVRNNLKVEIINSLQAYMTKACHNEAENLRLLTEKEEKKQAKVDEIKVAEAEKTVEIDNAKAINDSLLLKYENMSAEEKQEIEKEAEKYFLEQAEQKDFTPLTKNIFNKNIRIYVIAVLKKSI